MTYSFLPAPKARDPEPSGFQFPGPDDRVTIVGMTGSGKSTFAMWLFAESADFNRKPWIFIDYKRETLISQAVSEELFEPMALSDRIPDRAGVYVVNPEIDDGPEPVNRFLRNVYKAGRVGIVIDETTMIPNMRGEANTGGPYQSLLSQGRSKEIPVWSLSQRPAFINRMAFTENNYFCAFKLKSVDDLDKVRREIPTSSRNYERLWGDGGKVENLPKRWSVWYDSDRDISYLLRPCPAPEKIIDIIDWRIDKAKDGAVV